MKLFPLLVITSLLPTSTVLAAVKGNRLHEFIYDWSSLGSGCRGQLDVAGGNVDFQLNPSALPSLNRYQLRFHLGKFQLESPVPKDQGPTNLEFARDCAIRVALNPPKGKRIASIEAMTVYDLAKEAQSEMKTLAQLTLGMSTLATAQLDFNAAESFPATQHELRLQPRRPAGDMAGVRCGQSKLLGLDLMLYIKRPNEKAKVNMTLQNQQVDVMVDLEDCTS